jgi:hypothetical protein
VSIAPFWVLLVTGVGGVVLLCIALAGERVLSGGDRRRASLALVPALDAALLAAFVFGEDTYRDNGTSRWAAYRSPGGALGPMLVVSLAMLVMSAVLLVVLAYTGHASAQRATCAVVGVAMLGLVVPTVVGFSTN